MSCKHGNHEAACGLCCEEDRIYAMLDEERAQYLQCSGALNRALERIKVLEGRYEQLAAHAEAMYHADDEEQLAIVCLAYRKWRDGE